MNTIIRSLAAAGALALFSVTASPASAAVVEHRHFVDSGTEPFTDCPGINAEVSWNDRVHEVLRTRPHSGDLVYFSVNVRGTSVYTNLDTGGTFTNVYRINDKDVSVVDNGDGTLTIIVASRGSFRWFDTDGNRVLRGAGLFRFQFMVEHSGTPNNPDDDVFIEGSFVELKNAGLDQTVGRDFCADLAQFTA
jgi:hypothetical protein